MDRTSRPHVVLALVSCLAAGCSPDGDGAEAAAAALPPGTPLEVEDAPRLSVGVLEGDTLQELDRVVTPFLLSDGSLVVPLAGASTLRVFAPDGSFAGALGRRGEGPGEFMRLSSAWARGDTLEAFDSRLNRITRFPPDGAAEVVVLAGPVDLAVPGALPDGWAVTNVHEVSPDGRDQMGVQHYGRDGAHRGEVARTEGMHRTGYSGGGAGPGPLSPRAHFAVSGGHVYVAETLTPRITVLDPSGTVVRRLTWEPVAGPTPAEALAVVAESAAALPPEGALLLRSLEDAEAPERISRFWGFLVDEEGYIWVRPYEPLRHAAALGGLSGVGPGGVWTILSPEGAVVATVELPAELEPVQVTSDAVVGIRRDAMGVESVRVHALRRR